MPLKILTNLFRKRGHGNDRHGGPAALAPLGEPVVALQAYPDVPVLDINIDQMGLKAFFLTKDYAAFGAINATMDNDQEARPVLNSWHGPAVDSVGHFQMPEGRFLECLREGMPGNHQRVMADFGALDGEQIRLIDVVTYPFMFSSRHELQVDDDDLRHPTQWLWKVNHNMLIGVAELLGLVGPALSFFHVSEVPIEYSPVHNLLVASDQYLSRSEVGRSEYLTILRNLIKDSTVVSAANPVMDDRYCYPRRLSEDGAPKMAELLKF